MLYNVFVVVIIFVYISLFFVILFLYVVVEKFDFFFLDVVRDLGVINF